MFSFFDGPEVPHRGMFESGRDDLVPSFRVDKFWRLSLSSTSSSVTLSSLRVVGFTRFILGNVFEGRMSAN
jgi:hypothetical protein